MAKVTAPLLSLGAKGTIADSLTFAAWRGISYVRQRVVPSNPNTQAQQETRNVFAALDETWKRMATLSRAPWIAEVERRPLTPRNALFRANITPLLNQTDMTGWIGSMGARAGLPPTSISATGGALSGEIDVTVGTPKVPTGWTLASAVAQAVHDRDPSTLPTEFVAEAETASPTPDSTATVTVTGLTGGDSYVCAAWLTWTRPDGRTAYGASLTSNVVQATT